MSTFKVGSVYRTQCGAVVRLFNEDWGWGCNGVRALNGLNLGGREGPSNGQWLLDGRYLNGPGGMCEMSLLPGELEYQDGQWVAKEESLPDQCIPGSVCLGDLHGNWCLCQHSSKDTEPRRPRLTWADPKPSDRFAGYEVTSSTTEPKQYHSPLQVLGEPGDPVHGSSALLK